MHKLSSAPRSVRGNGRAPAGSTGASTHRAHPAVPDRAPRVGSACACGGGCPRCRASPTIQTKLAVSQAGDTYEQEADRVADQVMRGAASANPATPVSISRHTAQSQGVQRQCGACASAGDKDEDQDAILQTKSAASATPTTAPPIVGDTLRSAGRPLDAATRGFFESRLGADFGDVRIHTDAQAAHSAQAVNALAYTVGSDVVFGAGHYAPTSAGGRRLLAHELTHVVQQRGAAPALARTANPTAFFCNPNTHGAPASPFGELDAIDQHARGLASAAANLAIIGGILNPVTGTHPTLAAYRARFGTPTASGGGFRNRFSGAVLATQEQAAQEEIMEIGDRLDRLSTFLGGSIRYTCRGAGVAFTHSNCTSTCHAGDVAFTCTPQDLRRIEICPGFWALSDPAQQAIAIVHESVHMLLDFVNHGSASRGARGRNPECYASFVADIFGITPFDGRCPPLP